MEIFGALVSLLPKPLPLTALAILVIVVFGGFSLYSISGDVDDLQVDVGRLKEDVTSIENRVTQVESEIGELRQDVTSLRRDVRDLREDMERNHTEVLEAIEDLKELFTRHTHREDGGVNIAFSPAFGR